MSGHTIHSLPSFSEQHSNDMDHNITIRPPKRPAPGNYSDRAQARMIRQKLIEQEQEIEDREALRITSEELRILRDSFSSVKAEFTDLDGLSWDTPIARQVLLNWHAQQAVRASFHDELDLNDLAHRMRGASHSPSPRRSLASIMRPPDLSANATSVSDPPTSNPMHDVYDPTATVRAPRDSLHGGCASDHPNGEALELTIRARAHVGAMSIPATSPASRALGVLTNNENERITLPALFKSVPREDADIGLTPQPHRLSFDIDSVPDVEPGNSVPTSTTHPRPAPPLRSHSSPCVPLARGPFLRSCSPPFGLPTQRAENELAKSERPIKRLPPSRIPISRSNSLGATSSARLAARCISANANANDALPASASAPAVPFRAYQSLSPSSARRSPPARKPVPFCDEVPPRAPLANSPTLNRDPSEAASLSSGKEPPSPTSPSTKLYPLSPAHRGRVGYNYRPARRARP